MANAISVERNRVIDCFLQDVLKRTEKYCDSGVQSSKKDYVDAIIDIIIGSLKRPIVRDVND